MIQLSLSGVRMHFSRFLAVSTLAIALLVTTQAQAEQAPRCFKVQVRTKFIEHSTHSYARAKKRHVSLQPSLPNQNQMTAHAGNIGADGSGVIPVLWESATTIDGAKSEFKAMDFKGYMNLDDAGLRTFVKSPKNISSSAIPPLELSSPFMCRETSKKEKENGTCKHSQICTASASILALYDTAPLPAEYSETDAAHGEAKKTSTEITPPTANKKAVTSHPTKNLHN